MSRKVTADCKSLATRGVCYAKTTTEYFLYKYHFHTSTSIANYSIVVLHNQLSCCKTFAICCRTRLQSGVIIELAIPSKEYLKPNSYLHTQISEMHVVKTTILLWAIS